MATLTEELATTQAEISRLQEQDLDIDRMFNATTWVLQRSCNTWLVADLEGKQRLQEALFPAGLLYSRNRGYWNPGTPKAFNTLEALKASPSRLAGLMCLTWNPFAAWLRELADVIGAPVT